MISKFLENPVVYNIAQKILLTRGITKKIVEALHNELADFQYNKALDVGCGTGIFACLFKTNYFGTDINPAYLTRVRQTKEGFFFVSDGTSLSVKSKAFPLVINIGVLHHLELRKRKKLLSELWRVSKPEGKIIIIDGIIPSNRFNLIGFILAKLDRGRYKTKEKEFKEFIHESYFFTQHIMFTSITSFPYEVIIASIKK